MPVHNKSARQSQSTQEYSSLPVHTHTFIEKKTWHSHPKTKPESLAPLLDLLANIGKGVSLRVFRSLNEIKVVLASSGSCGQTLLSAGHKQ